MQLLLSQSTKPCSMLGPSARLAASLISTVISCVLVTGLPLPSNSVKGRELYTSYFLFVRLLTLGLCYEVNFSALATNSYSVKVGLKAWES